MPKPSREDIARALLALHGKTFSEQIGIEVENGSPDALFQLLMASLLSSIRLSWKIALKGTAQLIRKGWYTPKRMLSSTWEQRVKALDEVTYVRYDESMSRKLEEMARGIMEQYGGDLNNLRERAGRDPAKERELLEQFKGIGDVGADIFFREVQAVWEELYPFADRKALAGARALGLGGDVNTLARLVRKNEFPRLVAGLVWTELEHDHACVLDEAHRITGRLTHAGR